MLNLDFKQYFLKRARKKCLTQKPAESENRKLKKLLFIIGVPIPIKKMLDRFKVLKTSSSPSTYVLVLVRLFRY